MANDVMNLVAKLTLNPSEYERALRKAEQQGKNFRGDATGIIHGEDQYTDVVKDAESAAKEFKGNVDGTVTGHDEYTPEEKAAQISADKFDGDKEGTLTAQDEYSEVTEAAQTAADEYAGDYDAKLKAQDETEQGLTDANASLEGYEKDYNAKLGATDNASETVGAAKSTADGFEDSYNATLGATDNASETVGSAKSAADGFEDEYDATLKADDQTGDTVDAAKAKAAEFDGDHTATLKADDKTGGTVDTAKAKADEFDGEHTATLKATDNSSSTVDTAKSKADGFDSTYTAELKADDSDYTSDLESAKSDGEEFDRISYEAELFADDTDFESDVSDAETSGSEFDKAEYEAAINGDPSDWNQALSDAEENANTFITNIQTAFQKIDSFFNANPVVLGVKELAGAFLTAANNTAQYADAVDKNSRALSMSTQTYQVWDHALAQSGASIDDLSRGWLNLTDAIYEAKYQQDVWAEDTGDVKAALEALSINPKNFQSVDAMFDNVIEKLAQLEGGTERDTLVNMLFGRGGTRLNALLDSGVSGIEALKQEAYDLGLVLSDEQINSGVAYGDAVANMNSAIDALKNNVITGLLPELTKAANAIAKIAGWLTGKVTGTDTLEGRLAKIDDAMSDQIATANSDEKAVKGLLEYMNSLMTTTGVAAENMDDWEAAAQKVKTLCPELAPLISANADEWKKNADEIERVTKAYFNNARAQAVNMATEKKQQALAEQAAKIATKGVDVIELQSRVGYNEKTAQIASLYNSIMSGDDEMLKDYLRNSTDLNEDTSKWGAADYSDLLMTLATFHENRDWMQDVRKLYNDDEFFDALDQISDWEEEIAAMNAELDEATKKYEAYRDAAHQYILSLQTDLQALPTEVNVDVNVNGGAGLVSSIDGTGAKGINYVPYDGYIAELHRGEIILNQGQSRQSIERSGIDTGELAASISSAIVNSLAGMSVVMDGTSVGNVVTDQVSRNIAAQIRSGRYT